MHDRECIWPDPHSFVPERWLVDNETRRQMDKYYVPFGKGARMCVGMNLANAMLYLVLANVIRNFDFEVYKTTDRDLEIVADFFAPMPRRDSIGFWAMLS
jgi:cytochrome P450